MSSHGRFAALLVGITAVTAQILLMREFMRIFDGNELSLSLILAGWLVWTALGSGIAGRLHAASGRWIVFCQLAVAIVLPTTLLLLRGYRRLIGVLPGETLSLPQLLLGVALLLPLCALLGGLFVIATRWIATSATVHRDAIRHAYLYESIGAGTAGLLMSLFLVQWFNPWQIVSLLALLNLSGLLAVVLRGCGGRLRHLLLATVGLLGALAVLYVAPHLEWSTRAAQWPGHTLLAAEDSPYGSLTVTQLQRQTQVYESGVLVYSSDNPQTAEETTHPILLQHPSPRQVLLIGGGLGGGLAEILKYPVERLDYVELDPLLPRLASRFLPAQVTSTERERVQIHLTDARRWIQTRPPESYDVVLMSLPEPSTARLARLYSLDFFREVSAALRPGGVFGFSLPFPENYLSPEQRLLMGALERSLQRAFPTLVLLPGLRTHFIAQKSPPEESTLTRSPTELLRRLNARSILTHYVHEGSLPARLNPIRLRMFDKTRQEALDGAEASRDLRPVAYFHSLTLWLSQFRQREAERANLGWFRQIRLIHLLGAMALFLIAAAWWSRHRAGVGITLSIATTGFSEMLFQVVVLLAFQTLYGSVYYKLSLILAAFMVGLTFGALAVRPSLLRRIAPMSLYRWTQLGVSLYPLILLIAVMSLHALGQRVPRWFPAETLFALLPVLAGFLGGFQFPLAGHLQAVRGRGTGRTTGLLYAVDLLGSCVGALLAGLLFVPLLGLLATCFLASLLNLGILGILWISPRSAGATNTPPLV